MDERVETLILTLESPCPKHNRVHEAPFWSLQVSSLEHPNYTGLFKYGCQTFNVWASPPKQSDIGTGFLKLNWSDVWLLWQRPWSRIPQSQDLDAQKRAPFKVASHKSTCFILEILFPKASKEILDYINHFKNHTTEGWTVYSDKSPSSLHRRAFHGGWAGSTWGGFQRCKSLAQGAAALTGEGSGSLVHPQGSRGEAAEGSIFRMWKWAHFVITAGRPSVKVIFFLSSLQTLNSVTYLCKWVLSSNYIPLFRQGPKEFQA